MAVSRGTSRHAFRVDDALWEEFGRVADPDRTTLLVAYMKRYIASKGGTIPKPAADRRTLKRDVPPAL